MKKNYLSGAILLKNNQSKHIFRIMRLILFLLLVFTGFTFANNANSQNARVNLNKQKAMLKEVLEEIESQTDYLFVSNRDVNLAQNVSIRVRNKPVRNVLDNLFENTDLSYAMEGVNIILSKTSNSEVENTSNVVLQQRIVITGTVTDSEGTMPGVNVKIKGTSTGIVTDINGKFSINVPDKTSILVFSFIGYASQEIAVGEQNVIDVELSEDTQALDEVVVVGYGTVRKKDLTGSVSSIDNKLIAKQSTVNTSQALRGQVAGLSVKQTSGKASATSEVILRGQSAIGKVVQPLVIIDGMPADWTIFNNLNPLDIERLDVLKDASSTAIYGSRASGGVVIVTTRTGTEGKNRISYDGYYGVQTLAHMPRMKNTSELKQMYDDAIRINGQISDSSILKDDEIRNIENGISTDWLDKVTRNGMQTSHNLSVSGGNKHETHFMSVGYNKVDGNQKSDSYERTSLNVKVTGMLYEKLFAGAAVYAAFSKEVGGNGNILNVAYRLRPWGNPYNEDGSDRFFPTVNESNMANPIFDLKNTYNERKRFFANGSIFLEFKPIDGVSLKTNFMPSYYGERYGQYSGVYTTTNKGVAGTSTARANNQRNKSYTWENTLSLIKKINDHSISAIGLFSVESKNNEGYDATVQNLTYENEYWYNLAASTSINSLTSSLSDVALISYMLRANYGYRDKYLLTVTGRWDGSSKLATGHQWGFFPSTALAWRAGEEDFIKDLDLFSNLKLRLSYGVAGNNAVSNYSSWATLSTTAYDFDGATAKGAAAKMSNKMLAWEKSYEYNLGVDMGFFRERLSASVDLYHKTTKDIILPRKVPSHQGVTELQSNIGSVLNKGIEVSISSINFQNRDFSWSTHLNLSINHNEILDLYGDKKDDIGNKYFIGQPVSVNYDYKAIGIWQEEEKEEAAVYGTRPGNVKRWDKGGDGKITPEDDQVILGSTFPSWTGGITNNFTYKNFDFSFFIYTRQGEQVRSGFHTELTSDLGTRYNVYNLQYWTPENRSNTWPGPAMGSSLLAYRDVSFWRVGNITLGYRLKQELIKRLGISDLRIYMTANNPLIFTKYEGWDPEWATAKPSELPIGGATYMVGVNLSF